MKELIRVLFVFLSLFVINSNTSANTSLDKQINKNILRAAPVEASTAKQIKTYHDLTVKTYAKSMKGFGNNEASIIYLEKEIIAYLEKKPRSDKEKQIITQIYGAFYGETLIKNFGGKWVYVNGSLAIQQKHGYTFPFSTMRQFIDNGYEDSLYSAYLVSKKLVTMSEQEILNKIHQPE